MAAVFFVSEEKEVPRKHCGRPKAAPTAEAGSFSKDGGRGNSLSPLSRCARHLPLIRGVVPSPTRGTHGFQFAQGSPLGLPPHPSRFACHLPLKGKAGGCHLKAFPFRGRCPRRGRMRYPVFLNRYRWFGKARRGCETAPAPISRKARAQWPGRNRKPPLRFCAPEIFCLTKGVTPVNGVRGKQSYGPRRSEAEP